MGWPCSRALPATATASAEVILPSWRSSGQRHIRTSGAGLGGRLPGDSLGQVLIPQTGEDTASKAKPEPADYLAPSGQNQGC